MGDPVVDVRFPHETVWAGEPDWAPAEWTPVVAAACCGWRYSSDVGCVDLLLQVLLRIAAENYCDHTLVREQLCPDCGDRVLQVAEHMRESEEWAPDRDDGSHISRVTTALNTVVELGLITRTKAAELDAGYDFAGMPGEEPVGEESDIYLTEQLREAIGSISLDVVHTAIDLAQQRSWPDRPVIARREGNEPLRAAYHRAEPEIARRYGLPDLPRFMVEQAVRDAAVGSLTEADFVRVAHASGLRLIPRTSPTEPGVVAYSAILTSFPEAVQREYGASQLAADLMLSNLRDTWQCDSPMQAWATWRHHTGVLKPRTWPEPAEPGRWR